MKPIHLAVICTLASAGLQNYSEPNGYPPFVLVQRAVGLAGAQSLRTDHKGKHFCSFASLLQLL